MHRAGPLTRRLIGLALLAASVALAGCDLPGARRADAAVINGHAIPRARWDHLVEVLKSHVPVDLNSDPGRAQLLNIETQSLRAVIREQLVEDFARQRRVEVTSAEVDGEVTTLAAGLGGQGELNKRLDQTGETIADVRHTIRINLLQKKMRAASKTYQGDFDRALRDAQVSAYVPPCDQDHAWPACAGGQR